MLNYIPTYTIKYWKQGKLISPNLIKYEYISSNKIIHRKRGLFNIKFYSNEKNSQEGTKQAIKSERVAEVSEKVTGFRRHYF